MAFDISSAKPENKPKGFDINTAKPAQGGFGMATAQSFQPQQPEPSSKWDAIQQGLWHC